jgi:hypothetical protein
MGCLIGKLPGRVRLERALESKRRERLMLLSKK